MKSLQLIRDIFLYILKHEIWVFFKDKVEKLKSLQLIRDIFLYILKHEIWVFFQR
jgi:hypothetical protein